MSSLQTGVPLCILTNYKFVTNFFDRFFAANLTHLFEKLENLSIFFVQPYRVLSQSTPKLKKPLNQAVSALLLTSQNSIKLQF